MVKVIKSEPAPEAVLQAVCKRCGATLEYLPLEVQEQALYYMGEYDCTRRWIECPKCKSDVQL